MEEGKKKLDVQKELEAGNMVHIIPQGNSMYPMLRSHKDEVVLGPVENPKVGDVIIFRGKNDVLVLHRLAKIKKDGYYFVGDNQSVLEGPIPREKIYGILVCFIRKGRQISVKNPIYKFLAISWLWLLPLRNPIHKVIAWLRRLFKITVKPFD